MKNQSTSQRIGLVLGMLMVIGAVFVVAVNSQDDNQASAPPEKKQSTTRVSVTFTQDGELVRPTGYRRWIYAGTPLTPNDMNNGKAPFPEFHSVYIDPHAYDHYEKTESFPDGTVLVKELVSVGSKEASSGNGHFMGDFIGLEILMKDKT